MKLIKHAFGYLVGNNSLQMKTVIAVLLLCAVSIDAAPTITTLYTISTARPVWGKPTFHENVLIVNSYDRTIRCVQKMSGVEIWQKTSENSLRGDLVLDTAHNAVIDVSLSGAVTQRDISTGATKWVHQRKSYTWVFSPLLSGKHLFVPMRNDDLVILDTATGKELAQWPSTSGVWSAPLLLPPTANEGTARLVAAITASAFVLSGTFAASNASVGLPSWKFDLVPSATHYKQRMHAWIFGSPVFCQTEARPQVIFGASDRTLRSLRPDDGTLLWSLKLSGKVSSSPVTVEVSGQQFPVVLTENGDIVCVNGLGRIRWQTSLRQTPFSNVGLTVLGNIVVGGSSRGLVLGIDGTTGDLLFQWTISQCGVRASPGLQKISDSSLLVAIGCDDGKVHVARVDGVRIAAQALKLVNTALSSELTVLKVLSSAVNPATQDPAVQPPTAIPLVVLALASCVSVAGFYLRRHHKRTKLSS